MPASKDSTLSDQKPLCPDLDEELYHVLGYKQTPNAKQAAEIAEACAKDPAFYIFGGFVRSFDGNDNDQPIKPFLDNPGLRWALAVMHDDDLGKTRCFQKSRQVAMTWLCCAYMTHHCRFISHRLGMIQSKVARDAHAFVYKTNWNGGRCGFIERAMPPILRARGLMGLKGNLIYPQGSQIFGIPQGEEHARSYNASLAMSDEACFQPEFGESYDALVFQARRLIIWSSALGRTAYARLIEEGDEDDFETTEAA